MIRILITLVCVTQFVSHVSSQERIEYGGNLSGEISELGEIKDYTFTAAAGDIIWIRIRDLERVDAAFRLYDPADSLIVARHDIGGLASFQDLLLVEAGEYHLEVYDYNHNDVGRYGLSLQKLNSPEYGTWLPCFVNFDDSIRTTSAVNVFSFVGNEGDIFSTQMRSLTSHLESEFYLYDQSGEMLTVSKRNGRTAGAVLDLPYSGEYHLYITDRGGNDRDLFGCSVLWLNASDCYPSITCGQTQQGILSTLAARHPYLLTMEKDEHGVLQARSPDPSLEINVEVYSQDGTLLVSAVGSDRMIEIPLSADQQTTYLVVVQDKHGNDFGSYGLHYEAIKGGTCSHVKLCESSNEFNLDLDAIAQLRSYQVYGVAGEQYSFALREKDKAPEPFLRMYDPAGTQLHEIYGATKVEVAGVFPSTGWHQVLIGDRSGNDLGAMSMFWRGSEAQVILPETVTMELGSDCVELFPEVTAPVHAYRWSTTEVTPEIEYCGPSQHVSVEVEFANGCTGRAETQIILEEDPCQTADFDNFDAGIIVGHQLDNVRISAQDNKGPLIATIFPSADPPLGTEELGTPNGDFGGPGKGKGGNQGTEGANHTPQDKVLVIAENTIDRNDDGKLDILDDRDRGGTLIFEFEKPVDIQSLKVIDIRKEGSKIEVYDQHKKIGTWPLGPLGDNSVQKIDIGVSGASRMEIRLKGSGAIDDIVYCESDNRSPLAKIGRLSIPAELESSASDDLHRLTVNKAPELGNPSAAEHGRSIAVIYPNPTDGGFGVNISSSSPDPVTISIYDLMGTLMYQSRSFDPTVRGWMMDHFDYPSGVYLVEIKSETSQQVQRLVKR